MMCIGRMTMTSLVLSTLALAAVWPASSRGDDNGLKAGKPEMKSIGVLAMGPKGVLLAADPQGASIFAIEIADKPAGKAHDHFKVEGLDGKISALLGAKSSDILINDMAVNPNGGDVYVSVSRGRGPDAQPALARVDSAGRVELVSLDNVKFARAELPSPPAGRGRQEAITDMAFVDGKVFVACLSNEEFASKFRAIPFPFTELDAGTSAEIYHGSHGRFETASPIRTFVPYTINGEANLLAAYTCTPLVKFPVSDLRPGAKVRGSTIAELGNRNRPLDMIVYTKGGKDFLLMANSSRGVMKISTEGIDKAESITTRVGDKAGTSYVTVDSMKGVEQLDRLDNDHALVLIRAEGGALNLEAVELP